MDSTASSVTQVCLRRSTIADLRKQTCVTELQYRHFDKIIFITLESPRDRSELYDCGSDCGSALCAGLWPANVGISLLSESVLRKTCSHCADSSPFVGTALSSMPNWAFVNENEKTVSLRTPGDHELNRRLWMASSSTVPIPLYHLLNTSR